MTREEIIEKLCNRGYDTYVVGGYIRDMLIGRNPHDEDIVTAAKPDQIAELFKTSKITIINKYFLTIVDGIDIATFRQDHYKGLTEKDVVINPAKTIEEDLSRRDLTINSLAFCQQTGDIIDLFGGKEDLQNRIIRFVGDPEKRIYEDKNRIIRACRFLASIEGRFEEETRNALIKYAHCIRDYVDPERIRIEILKALKTMRPSLFFKALRSIGGLQYIFPSLDCCYDFEHGPYHKEDVFEHNMLCGDNITSKMPLLKLSGYLHDVGKPFCHTYNPLTKDLSFKQHEKEGATRVRRELKNLTFSNFEVDYISSMVRLHMRVIEENMTPKAIRKLLQKLNENNVHYKDLIRLRLADRKANLKKGAYPLTEAKKLVVALNTEIFKTPATSTSDLELNGNDIMKITNFKPGPIIGKILSILVETIIEHPEMNTKENLTELVKEYISE